MKNFLIISLFALSLSACASIVSDSDYPVSIQSAPDGATFKIKNENGIVVHKGKTPMTVTLEASSGYFSKARYTIEYTKNGEQRVSSLNSKLDGWFFGNILFGGPIGLLIIDPITGAMFKLPKVTSVSFDDEPKDKIGSKSDSITIKSIDDLTKDQIAMLIPLD